MPTADGEVSKGGLKKDVSGMKSGELTPPFGSAVDPKYSTSNLLEEDAKIG